MRLAPVTVTFVVAGACSSSPPPKAAEPEPAPLVIPPLPPQKEPEPRPIPREAVTGGAVDPDAPLTPPGALALPCSSDAECMTHRCNLRFAKCAFPCKTDRDCIAGATCYTQGGAMATCIPMPVP